MTALLRTRCRCVHHISHRRLSKWSTPEKWEEWEKLPAWEKRQSQFSNFPDFIEKWTPARYYSFGSGLTAWSVYVLLTNDLIHLTTFCPAAFTAIYFYVGFKDRSQRRNTIRYSFPVLGNIRYILETLRPEIRQYFIEGDKEALPFSRFQRTIVYQRAKAMPDSDAFGTKRDVYHVGYEWVQHSIFPTVIPEQNQRIPIGEGGKSNCIQPYSAALLNISGMSYGALSDNAILALNEGAKMGNFYHNTGEGGISEFHLKPGGDLVWNVGTGYFGCRSPDGSFNREMFADNASRPEVKMIELKLSQGAKPGHGGMLPAAKITPAIMRARGLDRDDLDVNSPPNHTLFTNYHEFIEALALLQELSGGKPVGFKMCLGQYDQFCAIVKAMMEVGFVPDFVTVDGAEGGTGAAPSEFSNNVGMPLVDALRFVDNTFNGAGLRQHVKIISSGKIYDGFSMIKHLSLGADMCNSARAMMFALGCVQSLKCNTNHCPTGVATQDPRLMAGLHIPSKSVRVFNFQERTVHSAVELMGAMGLSHPDELDPRHVVHRVSNAKSMTYADLYPKLEPGSLLRGEGPALHQASWDRSSKLLKRNIEN